MKRAPQPAVRRIARSIAKARRARVIALVEALPGAIAVAVGSHLSLEVRRKRFGWYLDDHHGDGRLAVHFKAPRGAAARLASSAPDRYHVPKYLGRHGWAGLWLDGPKVDWGEVEGVLRTAYAMVAPKELVATLDEQRRR